MNITVFERSEIGGRSTIVSAFGDPAQPLELGASIFVEINRNLFVAAKDLGLDLGKAGEDRPRSAKHALGVWDGLGFRFLQDESSSWWHDLFTLLRKYGLAPIKSQLLMKRTINTFVKGMYEDKFPFQSLTEASRSLNLTEATSRTGDAFLKENGISGLFAEDIVQASSRVNYAQNLKQLHGLETMVCLATEGAVFVRGGNFQIFERMLSAARANVLLNTTATMVSKEADGSFVVESSSPRKGQVEVYSRRDSFDSVVIATPFQFSDLSISPPSIVLPEKIPYVKLYVTLFTSFRRLAPAFFGVDSDDAVPEVVLTTLINSTAGTEPCFLSISTLRRVRNPESAADEFAYKIFSKSPLNSTFIAALLGFNDPGTSLSDLPKHEVSWIFEKTWNSYPYLEPRTVFPPLRLDKDLYYSGGMDPFISTMETNSLMGKNIAKLIANRWRDTDFSLQADVREHLDV